MVDPSRWRPEELDLLEDALEDLERQGVPEAMVADHPEVASTLRHYREILLSTRDALDEPPPAHVLDHVFAVAAGELADVDAPAEIEATARPERPRSWWKRWNARLWIPGLALAGSAALVLVIVRPTAEDATVARMESSPHPSMSAVDSPSAAAGPEPVADQADGTRKMIQTEARMEGEAVEVPAEDADRSDPAFAPLPQPAPEVPPAQGTIMYEESARSRGADEAQTRTNKGSAPPKPATKSADLPGAPVPPSAEKKPSKKSGATQKSQTQLDRADALREAGRCSDAEPIYRDVDGAAANDAERAQAVRGLGLCARAGGREAEAETLLRRAQDLAQ